MLNRVLKFLIAFLFLGSASFGAEVTCSSGSIIRSISFEKVKVDSDICFITDTQDKFYVSKLCKKKCAAISRRFIPVDRKKLFTSSGKPGFKLCKAYGGKPELIDIITKDNKKIRTDRCVFSDESFVSTEYLLKKHFHR